MKTTDFLHENTVIAQESPEDISMVVNNLHTIMRVTADLANRLSGNEELDEWVKEKIAVAKAMMTTVEDYVASQQEMGGEEESLPSFDTNSAEQTMSEMMGDGEIDETFSVNQNINKSKLKQGVAEGKPQKRADRYHINKDGKPASLASYADKSSAVKEQQLSELDLFDKQKTYFKMGNGQWIVANYRNVGSLNGPAFDQQFFRSLQWLAPAASQALGLDRKLADKGPMGTNVYDFTDANSLSHNNVNRDLIDAVQDWVTKNPPANTAPSQQVAQNQQQGVAEGSDDDFEEWGAQDPKDEMYGVGDAYKRGIQDYRKFMQTKAKPSNPYSYTKQARQADNWEKGFEDGRYKQDVAEGAPIVVMPSHKRLEKKHKPSLSRGMDPAKAQGEQDARDGKPYNNPYPFKKELGAPGNWEHNSYKAAYDSVKQGVAEGFPDDILAMAKKVSPNARIRGSRDEEIARRDAMLAQRARDHANAPEPKGVSDDERASLEAELQQLMPKYDKDYQMIDKYTQYMQAKHIADRVHEIQRKLKSGVAEGILAEDIMGLGDNEFEPKQHHDPEGNMARNELYRNAKYALDLLKMIEPDDEIEPWVAANLTNAATWLDKVYHYLDYRTKFEPEMDMKKDDKGIKESEAEPSGDIARMNLQEIMEYSIKLFKMIKPETRLDGWVAMKLTKASECVSSSKHYLEHQYFEKHSSDMYESKILKKFAKTLSKK